jgi:hypothetical protein
MCRRLSGSISPVNFFRIAYGDKVRNLICRADYDSADRLGKFVYLC